MCIEYNECHYGGMYNINVKIIFVITEIVHMNAGVSSEKEKVKESQSQSRSVTPPLDTPFGCRVGGVTIDDAPFPSVAVEPQNAPEAPPLPLGKDKRKINLIKYPKGSDFLNAAVRHAVNVGPSRVGPSYGAIFAERYRPPPGVRIWVPDVLTLYTASVPGMVCFFEVAFENGLRFPLHPFIKGVLQHFNICSSQLSPNGWGILVGLLAFFRDRGFGVPSIALLLHLFSPKDTAEGFIYFSRRSGAPLVISDLPSSHRSWKGRYFFVSGYSWEYNLFDKDDTLGVPTAWNAPDNLRECLYCFQYGLFEDD